tara:strand:- start:373 stop:825 length:453 start_codon:yes stop_codon:yes gene_type:complete
MGLDASVIIVEKKTCGTSDDEQYSGLEGWIPSTDDPDNDKFYWRKHARLQVFMCKQHEKQNPMADYKQDSDLAHLGFNADGVFITEDVLDELEKAIENDYWDYFCSDGFFWGHQFQEEAVKEYKEQDKEFLAWAREQVKNKKNIIYTCSW